MSVDPAAHYTDLSLVVGKDGRIFRGHRVMYVGSGDALKAWKVLDFVVPRLFNIAIMTPKIALKQSKSFITLADGPYGLSLKVFA